MFSSLYPEEDDVGEGGKPTDGIAYYNEIDEDLPGEVSDFNDEEVGYVDFLSVDDILLNSPNDNSDEFYAVEENYIFTKETTTNSFLIIFMAHGREKMQGKCNKLDV
jgi:hypothetical protein